MLLLLFSSSVVRLVTSWTVHTSGLCLSLHRFFCLRLSIACLSCYPSTPFLLPSIFSASTFQWVGCFHQVTALELQHHFLPTNVQGWFHLWLVDLSAVKLSGVAAQFFPVLFSHPASTAQNHDEHHYVCVFICRQSNVSPTQCSLCHSFLHQEANADRRSHHGSSFWAPWNSNIVTFPPSYLPYQMPHLCSLPFSFNFLILCFSVS